MSAKSKNFKPMLKYYHIFLLVIILCPFLISHSNAVNRRRKLVKEHEFIQNLFLRKLDFTSDTEAICSKGSEELKNYYLTRDDNSIGIKSDKIEKKNKEDVNALINLVASKGDTSENAVEYVKNLVPVLAILVLAILSIPGWIFLCSCACCGCCCCCCCKKSICKIPFYIITAVFYALALGISVYGLSQSDSIFVGLADTECSILKFIDQVLSGEGKNAPKPYWAGIDTIQEILRQTKASISNVKSSYSDNLSDAKSNIQTAKSNFENQLTTSNNVQSDTNYLKLANYKLDIVMKFGTYSSTPDPSNSETFLQLWGMEFNEKVSRSAELMSNMDNKFEILNGDSSIDRTLDDGINAIEPIKTSIDEVKNQISSIILDYSEKIDEYGKLAFKIVFTVLIVFVAAIAALMTIMLFFSFSCFDKCCSCCRCLLKPLIHILWNILALLTIITLFIGFLCTLIGKVGGDLISVVSFLVSEENLKSGEPILLTEAGGMLNKCINDNGDIISDLGLSGNPALESMEDLKTYKDQLIQTKQDFNEALSSRPDYYREFINKFKERTDYTTTDINLINKDDPNDKLNLGTYLNQLNDLTRDSKKEEWKIKCNQNSHSCNEKDSHESYYCIELKTCSSDNKISGVWYSSEDATLVGHAQKIDAIIDSIRYSNNGEENSINKNLEELNNKYGLFIEAENNNLDVYKNTIEQMTQIFEDIAGGGQLLSILNCKFIGKNVRVILKYLDQSLAKSFYNVGICLSVAGVAMFISIAFTILLNIIISSSSNKAV